jgi:SH3-like domain-containing protein
MKLKLYAAGVSLFCFAILCGLLSISFSVSANDKAYVDLNKQASAAEAPTKPVQKLEKKTISETKVISQVAVSQVAVSQVAASKVISANNEPNTSNASKKDNNDEMAIKKPNGETNLPTPRFVSIKSNEVNTRVGPGDNYPIKWVIVKKALPVEVVEEYQHWRKIRDVSGDEGWVHSAMISGERSAIILNKNWEVKSKPELTSKTIATIEKGVVVGLNKCSNEACEVRIGKVDGWLPRAALWGIYKNEMVGK